MKIKCKVKYVILGLIFMVAVLCPSIMLAADLIDVWHASQTRDPEFIISQFEQLAGEQRHIQGTALWLPNISFTATTGVIRSSSSTKGANFDAPGISGPYFNASFETLINNGNLNKHSLSLIQPIYDLERLTDTRKLQKSADISKLSAELARQKLILLVAASYFASLSADENFRLMTVQEKAIKDTYKEIKKRFQLGNASKTDLQEAAERLGNIRIKLISAKSNVQIKKLALKDLLGSNKNLKKLKENFTFNNFIGNLEQYITKMTSSNLQLRIITTLQDVAKQEVIKYRIGGIKLNAIAQVSRDRSHGSNNSSNTTRDFLLGMQLSAPLFTGGYRSAKESEALYLLEKSKMEYDRVALTTEQSIRAIWFDLFSSKSRIQALQNNLKINQSRLLLTIKGHAVGSRSTLEVLAAQSDAVDIENALYIEKIQFLFNQLHLNAMIGELTERDFKLINNYLE